MPDAISAAIDLAEKWDIFLDKNHIFFKIIAKTTK